ncbi:hypothetical protein GCM10017083_30690 [Thalassobaculum fulvum]|uniref:Uncharacterized protein n=1 Tax=Thalassobaculum fulvum TaxID=1633335 RepID=A0A918XU66_9PROT|nr:hypothetical protein GCM10017083_30690 [Thalassobaculum fulvum]
MVSDGVMKVSSASIAASGARVETPGFAAVVRFAVWTLMACFLGCRDRQAGRRKSMRGKWGLRRVRANEFGSG